MRTILYVAAVAAVAACNTSKSGSKPAPAPAAADPWAKKDVKPTDVKDPDLARLVNLRFFAGLTAEESAEALGVSPATIHREWACAKAWLQRELGPR